MNGATIGRLDGLSKPLFTLERPWRDNEPMLSCIPKGKFQCAPHGWNDEPVEKKQVWEVTNVEGRDAILFHTGNSLKDTQGCILIGLGLRIEPDISEVVLSHAATVLMRKEIGNSGFELEIV